MITLLRTRTLILALGILGFQVGTCHGQTLYGVTFNNRLITINTTTGAGTLVGNLSPAGEPFGLAFRGTKLYIYDRTSDRLREINPANAATIANININAIVSLSGPQWGEGDIAFRSDGMGFLSDSGITSQLSRFDITIPNSFMINPSLSPSMDGLAFNSANVLYGLNQGSTNLYTINQITGVATLVGPTGIVGPSNVNGIAFSPSGKLYAAVSNALPSAPSTFYELNPATGTATLIGGIGFNEVCGLSFAPPGLTLSSGTEGSYTGSAGPTGLEGSFGFGFGGWRRIAPPRPTQGNPALAGPTWSEAGDGTALVWNVSQRRDLDAATASIPGEDQGGTVWWVMVGMVTGLIGSLFWAAFRNEWIGS